MSQSASFNINFNLPPEVIREYFNGSAKVEKAKHAPSSDIVWSNVLTTVAPTLLGFFAPTVHGFIANTLSGSVRTPTPGGVGPSRNVGTPNPAEQDSSKESSEACRSDNVTLESVVDVTELVRDVIEKLQADSASQKNPDEHSSTEPNGTAPSKSSDNKTSTSNAGVSPSNGETSKCSTVKQEVPAAKRPVYDEDHPQTQGHGSMGGFGADASGAGGIADMMKMFGPLMGELMNGMQAGMNMPPGVKVEFNPGVNQKTEPVEPQIPNESTKQSEDKVDAVD